MKREKITISKSGIITLPDNPVETVWMRDFEIAELIGGNATHHKFQYSGNSEIGSSKSRFTAMME